MLKGEISAGCNGSIISAGEFDRERALIGSTLIISNGVADVDDSGLVFRKIVVASIGWIEQPRAISIDSEAWDLRTNQ